MSKNKTYILLFFIIALGFFLRIVNINEVPPGVYPDEAVNGLDALTALETGKFQWFYEANNGREGLFMNLIALCFKFLGVSVLTLKLPAIIFGTLTVLGTYLLAKELFSNPRLGIISAFLVASSFWAINFSRISFRANMLPFVLVFAFYFLMRGMRTRKYLDFGLSGAFFGLGLHTYIAYRITPLIFLAIFITFFFTRFTRKNIWKVYFPRFLVLAALAFLVAAPMLYTFYTHPEYITSRTGNVSILNPEVNQGHLVKTFFKSFSLSLLKYSIWGDQNWRHNFPPFAILDPITGIAFTFSLIYFIFRLIHFMSLGLFRKISRSHLEAFILLVSWFFVMLIPEFMTAEGNPHALRSIGTLPVVFILAACAFDYFIKKSQGYSYLFRKIVLFLMIVMLLVIGFYNGFRYHYVWAKRPETAQAFDKNLTNISRYINSLPGNREKFIVIEVMQRIPIQLLNWKNPQISYYYPVEIDQINPRSENFEIVLTDKNDDIFSILKKRFPKLNLEEKTDESGISFYVFK